LQFGIWAVEQCAWRPARHAASLTLRKGHRRYVRVDNVAQRCPALSAGAITGWQFPLAILNGAGFFRFLFPAHPLCGGVAVLTFFLTIFFFADFFCTALFFVALYAMLNSFPFRRPNAPLPELV